MPTGKGAARSSPWDDTEAKSKSKAAAKKNDGKRAKAAKLPQELSDDVPNICPILVPIFFKYFSPGLLSRTGPSRHAH